MVCDDNDWLTLYSRGLLSTPASFDKNKCAAGLQLYAFLSQPLRFALAWSIVRRRWREDDKGGVDRMRDQNIETDCE